MSETLSLESSKRLHELGVVVESEKCWWKWLVDDVVKDNCPEYPSSVRLKRNMKDESFFKERSAIPAPTFEELWAVMPNKIGNRDLFQRKGDNSKSIIGYAWIGNMNDTLYECAHESLTEALGQLAIWLAENGHMEVTE